ncbi:putative germin [Medicago truncatula]|uniref:Germin-like protein n=1 Tax=Medicago truncatula TaxID=3880 RepID=G7L6W0_MEDTR|nr:germin-like protein [Medicago truncatula]AET01764.2 auxin-binding protein ABP19b [Medicago truncatula]RHN39459.1 putative germin [Medicago truncatula]
MRIIYITLFYFSLLLSYASYATSVNDFCVADLQLPNTPSGYPCKSETNVTVDDFLFSDFVPRNTIDPFNVRLTTAFVTSLPGLNGLGISAARGDFGLNGTVPMHFHPDANELLIVVKGQLTAGFITPTKVDLKTVKPGDSLVIPKGLLHFGVNTDVGNAIASAFFSSSNPKMEILDYLLFGNDLSTSIIANPTLLDVSQIIKLKAQFRGSG